MMLFAFPPYERLARGLESEGLQRRHFTVSRFPNRELYVLLDAPVAGKLCAVVGSIAPPDRALLSTLLLCHTLKREGARTVLALLPYLAYARHDREESGKSRGLAWIGEVLCASGVDEVMTVDVHSAMAQRLLGIPAHSLSPARIFAAEILRLSQKEATIVAPDEGAVERCEAVRQAAGMGQPVAWVQKERTRSGVKLLALHGEIRPQAVVVDDILDTGGTLVSCCEALQHAGVRDILIMVTHGLFTGSDWRRLWSLGVTGICCTDTVPLPRRLSSEKITVLSVGPLMDEWLTNTLETRGKTDDSQ